MKTQTARALALKSIALSVALLLPTSGFAQVVGSTPMGSFGPAEGLPPGVSVEAHKALFQQMDLLAGEPSATLPVLQTLMGLHGSTNKENTPAAAASRILFSAVLSGEGREAVYARMKTAGLPEMTATRLAGMADRWTQAAAANPKLAQSLVDLRAEFTKVEAAEPPSLNRANATRDMIPFDGPRPQQGQASGSQSGNGVTTRYAFPTSVSKIVGELDVLAAKDPQAAVAKADAILADSKAEPRIEVRLHALRTLAKLGEGQEKLVEHAVKMSVSTSEHYYVKREAAKLGAVDNRPVLIEALKAMYKDASASVRLMAKASLLRLGVDPGPEIEPKIAARPVVPSAPQATNTFSKRPGPAKKQGGSFFKVMLLMGLMFGGLWMMSQPAKHAGAGTAAEPPAITQPVSGSSSGSSISAAPEASPAPSAEAPKPADSQQQLVDEVRKNRQATEQLASDVHQVVEKQKQAEQQKGGSVMFSVLFQLALAILPIFILIKLLSGRGGPGGVMNQLSQIKFSMERPNVTFNDVAGVDESKAEVAEIVDFLENPAPYMRQGARVPKGVILHGPPGTGKTLLAKAVANAANANFIAIKGSDFIEMFVGVGAARVRALFQYAREHGPCIIFIDEFDAVAKARGDKGAFNSHDERDQTINAFLAEMDGFDNSTGVIVMAATNRLDILDEAVTRPGRFDRKVEVTKPNVLGREAILAVHGKDKRLGADVDLQFIAKRTPGHSGADLANVMNEGAVLTVRGGKDHQSMDELNEAVDKGNMGVRKDAYITPADKRRLAVHEAGHVAARKGTGGKVSKVTIIGRGNAGGFAEGTHDEDKFLYTETELKAMIAMLMGSSAAEKGKLGELSTGAENDLERANDLARTMVRLGMSDDPELGFYRPRPTPGGFGQSDASPEMSARIDRAVSKILKEGMETAKKAIEGYGATFEALVDKLIEAETLSGDQVDEILRK
jgi:cell division protease FtsH